MQEGIQPSSGQTCGLGQLPCGVTGGCAFVLQCLQLPEQVTVVGFLRLRKLCSPQHNCAFPLGGLMLEVLKGRA